MDEEDFSAMTIQRLRVEWNRERSLIAMSQERQEAICNELLRRSAADDQ